MGTESKWMEKAKADWAKYRASREADFPTQDQEHQRRWWDGVEADFFGLPDSALIEWAKGGMERARAAWAKFSAEINGRVPDDDYVQREVEYRVRWGDGMRMSASEAIARIRESDRQWLDHLERTYVGLPDLQLYGWAKGNWYVNHWLRCVSTSEMGQIVNIMAVLKSRGYDPDEIEHRWYEEAEAEVRAKVDEIVAEGGRQAEMARAAVAEASDKATGKVDWRWVTAELAGSTDQGRQLLEDRQIVAIPMEDLRDPRELRGDIGKCGTS